MHSFDFNWCVSPGGFSDQRSNGGVSDPCIATPEGTTRSRSEEKHPLDSDRVSGCPTSTADVWFLAWDETRFADLITPNRARSIALAEVTWSSLCERTSVRSDCVVNLAAHPKGRKSRRRNRIPLAGSSPARISSPTGKRGPERVDPEEVRKRNESRAPRRYES